jgi:hypothetical protein
VALLKGVRSSETVLMPLVKKELEKVFFFVFNFNFSSPPSVSQAPAAVVKQYQRWLKHSTVATLRATEGASTALKAMGAKRAARDLDRSARRLVSQKTHLTQSAKKQIRKAGFKVREIGAKARNELRKLQAAKRRVLKKLKNTSVGDMGRAMGAAVLGKAKQKLEDAKQVTFSLGIIFHFVSISLFSSLIGGASFGRQAERSSSPWPPCHQCAAGPERRNRQIQGQS